MEQDDQEPTVSLIARAHDFWILLESTATTKVTVEEDKVRRRAARPWRANGFGWEDGQFWPGHALGIARGDGSWRAVKHGAGEGRSAARGGVAGHGVRRGQHG